MLERYKTNLVWVDLEMTGLNPERDTILEIATIVTNNDLEIIATGPSLAIHHSDEELCIMTDWCVKQHGNSGLVSAVKTSNISLREAAQATLNFLKLHVKENQATVCGNSVWQDRIFLRKYMPEVDNFLSYRIIDVSSIKEIVGRRYPDNPKAKFVKPEGHRALEDITYSIEELKHYISNFFIPR